MKLTPASVTLLLACALAVGAVLAPPARGAAPDSVALLRIQQSLARASSIRVTLDSRTSIELRARALPEGLRLVGEGDRGAVLVRPEPSRMVEWGRIEGLEVKHSVHRSLVIGGAALGVLATGLGGSRTDSESLGGTRGRMMVVALAAVLGATAGELIGHHLDPWERLYPATPGGPDW